MRDILRPDLLAVVECSPRLFDGYLVSCMLETQPTARKVSDAMTTDVISESRR